MLLTLDVTVCVLPGLDCEGLRQHIISGQTHDFSDTGFCLITSERLIPNSLLLCKISMPFAAATIPTLSQVRWTANHELHRDQYASGLQFLI
jgi:hypothetical protein